MCKKTMAPTGECTNSEDVVLDNSSSTLHDPLYHDDDDDFCGGGSDEKSLEDTLSLTCDDGSLSSRSDSITMEESSSDGERDVYRSPDVLRRRLLPLAPSPILGKYHDGSSSPIFDRNRFQSRSLWKNRSAVRLFCFGCSIMAYLFSTTLNYPSMIASIRGTALSRESQEWSRFFRRKAPKIMQKIPKSASNLKYTIRIKGHRLDLVLQSLDYHAQCPSVKSVQVEWTDAATKNRSLPESVLKHKSGKVEPYGKTTTPAVFLLDEDILLKCDEIERAFQEWRLDPSRLVGFYPFHHRPAAESESASLRSRPAFHLRQVSLGEGAYSMLSDRAVFAHNLFLRNLPPIPDQCQHLGLSIAVSSVTSKAPIAVMSRPQTTRQSNKKSAVFSRDASKRCQEWMETIGSPKLPNQVATIVGHQR